MGDRAVEAGRGTTVAELVAALAPTEADTIRSLRVDRNGAVLDPDRAIADLDLRSGDRVALFDVDQTTELDRGPDPEAKPSALLRMLTGPLAGESYHLPAGANMVGRTTDNDLALKDPGISRHHAMIAVDASAVVVTDLGSTNGIRIEGLPIDGPTALRSGQRLLLGQSWVAVEHHGVPVVPVEGRIGFERPHRMVPTYQGRTFEVPRPPDGDAGGARRGPLGSRLQNRQHDRVYGSVIDRVTADLNLARRQEREARSAECPSVDDVLLAVRSRTRLWERRETDPDVLQVRLGLAEQPSRHRIVVAPGGPPSLRTRVDRLPQTYAMIDGVPATLDIGRPGGLRLRGSGGRVRPVAAALVGQLVGLNPPGQLGVVLLGDAIEAWDWLKWLPHVDLDDGVTPTGDDARRLLTELLEAEPGRRPDQQDRPAYVLVVVDGTAEDDELVARLQTDGPARAVHPLIVDEGDAGSWIDGAPSGVGPLLTVEGPTARLVVPGDPSATVDPIAVERLEADAAVEFGRLLAPLSMGRIEGSERAAGPEDPSNGEAETASPEHETDGLVVTTLALGPVPAPVGPPDLFDLPRSTDDSRLVLGEIRMADETETILAFSPPRDGTLALAGTPVADLTGCLLTVAASAARVGGPEESRPLVYALGPAPGLAALTSLPIVARVVGEDPAEAMECLAELELRMADRLTTFDLAGVDDLDGFRQARPEVPLRRILVLVDGVDWLTSLVEPIDPGRTRQVVGQLLEIGSALGLHLVFTVGDRGDVDPFLAPKVGRWLDFDGDDREQGRVRLDGADVRFAAPGGSWEPDRLESSVAGLAAEIDGARSVAAHP